jgi:hypothetical protein
MKRQYPASRTQRADAAAFTRQMAEDQRALRTLLEPKEGGDAGCAEPSDDVARLAPEQASGPCLDVGEVCK